MLRPVLTATLAMIIVAAPAAAGDGAVHPRLRWHLCLEQSFERADEGLYEFEVRGAHTDPRGKRRLPITPGMVLADTSDPALYQPMLVVRVEQISGAPNPDEGETFVLKVTAICLQPNARPPAPGSAFQAIARLGDGPVSRALIAAAGVRDEHVAAATRLHVRRELDSYFGLADFKTAYAPASEPACITRARQGDFADCHAFLACARSLGAPASPPP